MFCNFTFSVKTLLIKFSTVKCSLSIMLALLLQLVTNAQHVDTILIVPGSDLLQTTLLQNNQQKYDFISFKSGVETIVGGLEENLHVIISGKDKQLLRVCNITFGTNKILDSGLCLLRGLKPIYHRSKQANKKLLFNFDKTIVSGIVSDADKKQVAVQDTSAYPLFDSYSEDLIARTIPLKRGFTFKFMEFIYERGGAVWSTGEVTDTSHLQRGITSVSHIWKVIFYEKTKQGTTTRTTTYIINDKDRSIVSREYITANGRVLMRKK